MRTRWLVLVCLAWCSGCNTCSPYSGGCGVGFGGSGSLFSRTSYCGPNCYNPLRDCWSVRFHARQSARRALKRLRSQGGGHLSCHFREGFEQAYVDIAEGGSGVTPPIPPSRYWCEKFRTADGFARSNEWFTGYSTGAAMAEQDGLKEYNRIPVSTGSFQG